MRPNSYPSSSSSAPRRFLRSPFLRESPRPAYSMPGLYRRRRRLSDLTSTSPKSVTAPGGMSSKDCVMASRTCRIRLVATERNSTTATRPFSASAKFAVLSMTGEDIAATAAGPPSAAMDASSLSERSWSATPPSDDLADRRGRTEAIRRAVSSSPRLAGAAPAPGAGVRDDAGGLAGDAGGAPPPPPGDASSPGADPRSVAAIVDPRFDVARTATTTATSAPSSAAGDAPNGAVASFDFDRPFAGVLPFAGVFGVFGGMVPTDLDPPRLSDCYFLAQIPGICKAPIHVHRYLRRYLLVNTSARRGKTTPASLPRASPRPERTSPRSPRS